MSIIPSLFDFGAAPASARRTQYGKTYDFNFSTGQFVYSGADIVVIDTTVAFAQSLEKLLRTERYRFLAYDGNYGNASLTTAGVGGTTATLLMAQIVAEATEALDAEPRTSRVANLVVTLDHPTAPTTVEYEADVIDTFGVTTSIDVTVSV